MPSPLGDEGAIDSGAEPRRQTGMPQVAGLRGERGRICSGVNAFGGRRPTVDGAHADGVLVRRSERVAPRPVRVTNNRPPTLVLSSTTMRCRIDRRDPMRRSDAGHPVDEHITGWTYLGTPQGHVLTCLVACVTL